MDILKTAQKTIQIEKEALTKLQNSLDESFVDIVKCLEQCRGKIVFTGIGKSALVAQKIAATFNSTGTNAIFIHATDAIHGDMGLINVEDVVVALTKSGDTSEIKFLLPILKSYDITTIALSSNPNSFVANNADYFLLTPVTEEADPNNLAPTTSTTIQMVVGDAMAISLLSLKGFEPEHFAKYHPGGSLGKQLYLKVEDLLRDNPPSVQLSTPLKEVLMEMSAKRLGATAVVSGQHELKGIITDGDVRRYFQNNPMNINSKAEELMTPSPKIVDQSELAFKAFTTMKEMSINHLVVTNASNDYIGIIHIHDLIKEGFV